MKKSGVSLLLEMTMTLVELEEEEAVLAMPEMIELESSEGKDSDLMENDLIQMTMNHDEDLEMVVWMVIVV
jgi:hypothetical protein